MADFLVVSIPVCLLWKVKIRPAQKFGLASFLCLSIVMAVMAIVRVSGLRIKIFSGHYTFDTAWQYLWQQIEASIAVCLVSLTAFRQLFVSHGPKRSQEPTKSWYSTTIGKLRRQKREAGEKGFRTLPSIPSATLSGMRTLIQGGRMADTTGTFDEEEVVNGWSPGEHEGKSSRQVRVSNDVVVIMEVCTVRLTQSGVKASPLSSTGASRRSKTNGRPRLATLSSIWTGTASDCDHGEASTGTVSEYHLKGDTVASCPQAGRPVSHCNSRVLFVL